MNIRKMPRIILVAGTKALRIKCGAPGDWIAEYEDKSRVCGDCSAKAGEFHDKNCDIERCPVCHGQLLSCDCWTAYSS